MNNSPPPPTSKKTGRKERLFLAILEKLFIGVEVDGKSGYINLMRVKASYFNELVKPALMTDIANALVDFPEFREELFDKLHAFFRRYFSSSGSICFAHTPNHFGVYEKVYTDEQDVALFWKTHMLYYVKTDRLFRNIDVKIDGEIFRFDCTNLEHKKSNEKRKIIYAFEKVGKDGIIYLAVAYSERGRKTNTRDILTALRKAKRPVREATLEKALEAFGRQGEVDYFINKDARSFLREQFDLWMYQYMFRDETRWTEKRVQELQVLKHIALNIIDFIAQFEDELVRIWNKPKFVRNSHYVVTLERLAAKKGGLDVISALIKHEGMQEQVGEWVMLGIVKENFDKKAILEETGERRWLVEDWRFLPVDTKYFAEMELQIIGLFDNLDQELDGRVIKSENYQALNTLQRKFRRKVRCVYIDPPYNSDGAEIHYVNEYRNSSWLSLVENRLGFVSTYLAGSKSALVVAVDDFEAPHLIRLLREMFPNSTVNPIVVNHHPQGTPKKNISRTHEYTILVVPNSAPNFIRIPRPLERPNKRGFRRSGSGRNNFREGASNSFYAILIDESTCEIKGLEDPPQGKNYPKGRTKEGWIRVYPINGRNEERVWRKSHQSAQVLIESGKLEVRKNRNSFTLTESVSIERVNPTSNWFDSKYNAGTHGTNLLASLFGNSHGFLYPKSIHAVTDIVEAITHDDDEAITLDFFAGSGTTAHAVLNLNRESGISRKYVLVEMAEYCDSVILPRVKKVSFANEWCDGKPMNDAKGVTHFLKYFELEQYEDTLATALYSGDGSKPFRNTKKSPYSQYVFLCDEKQAHTLDPDCNNDDIRVDLTKLYSDIDLAETLSCVTGKWIKRITEEDVEFSDGSKESLVKPDWELLKSLIFWGPTE